MKFNWSAWRQLPYLSKQKLSSAARALWSFFYIRIYVAAAVGLNLISWSIAIAAQYQIKFEQVVLHYNVDFGVDLYGDRRRLFFIPAIGLLALACNLVLAANISKEDRLAIHVLLAAAVLANLILLLAAVALYFYNLR